EKQDKDPLSVLHYYRQLIALRQNNQVFIEGDYTLYEAEHRHLYVYTRSLATDLVLVVGNHRSKPTRFTMPKALKDVPLKRVLTNVEHGPDDPVDVLKPFEVRVYQRR
ncbi:MAG: glucohydrolase, partial [Acholeplasmataceae bacterium]